MVTFNQLFSVLALEKKKGSRINVINGKYLTIMLLLLGIQIFLEMFAIKK